MNRAFSAHNVFLADEPGPLARAGMTDAFGVTNMVGSRLSLQRHRHARRFR
jgi:hypothetical protein